MSNPLDTFTDAFKRTQRALGLSHYDVSIEATDLAHFAEIECEPEDCVAQVRVNVDRCSLADNLESTAAHECLHLLLADFEHACTSNPKAARIEEERVVRRLEPWIHKALFS